MLLNSASVGERKKKKESTKSIASQKEGWSFSFFLFFSLRTRRGEPLVGPDQVLGKLLAGLAEGLVLEVVQKSVDNRLHGKGKRERRSHKKKIS